MKRRLDVFTSTKQKIKIRRQNSLWRFFFFFFSVFVMAGIWLKDRNKAVRGMNTLWTSTLSSSAWWLRRTTSAMSSKMSSRREDLEHFWSENGENSAELQTMFSSSKAEPRMSAVPPQPRMKSDRRSPPYRHLHFPRFSTDRASGPRARPFRAVCSALRPEVW